MIKVIKSVSKKSQKRLLKSRSLVSFRYNHTSQLQDSTNQQTTTTLATPLYTLLDDLNSVFPNIPKVLSKADILKTIVPATEDYSDFQPNKVKIGIIQSPSIPKGHFINALICDPWATNQDSFNNLKKIRAENPDKNIVLTYSQAFKQLEGSKYGVNAPILNKDLRTIQNETVGHGNTKSLLKRELLNDIDLIEINNPNYKDFSGVKNAETIDFSNSKALSELNQGCHLYIYVKSKESELVEINDYPSLTILNDHLEEVGSNFTSSNESVSVDLDEVIKANDLLIESSRNVSKYLSHLKNSKINSVLFTLNKETSGYRPTILLLNSLLNDISKELKLTKNEQIEKEVSSLRSQINEWAQLSHFELQSKITPYLENTLMLKFTKVSQLIWFSDDLALVISNSLFDCEQEVQTSVFSLTKEKCHGTLVDSASKLNYLEGKIDAILPAEEPSSTYNPINPLKELKQQVSEVKLPQLQEQVNKLLLNNFGKTTVPVFAVCALGDLLNYIELNTAVAFTVLSVALASYNISKDAFKLMNGFKDWYLENLRISIDKNLRYLNGKLDNNVKVFGLNLDEKKGRIKKLNNELDKLQKIEKELEKTS